LKNNTYGLNGSGGSGTEVVLEHATSGNLNLKTESLMG